MPGEHPVHRDVSRHSDHHHNSEAVPPAAGVPHGHGEQPHRHEAAPTVAESQAQHSCSMEASASSRDGCARNDVGTRRTPPAARGNSRITTEEPPCDLRTCWIR